MPLLSTKKTPFKPVYSSYDGDTYPYTTLVPYNSGNTLRHSTKLVLKSRFGLTQFDLQIRNGQLVSSQSYDMKGGGLEQPARDYGSVYPYVSAYAVNLALSAGKMLPANYNVTMRVSWNRWCNCERVDYGMPEPGTGVPLNVPVALTNITQDGTKYQSLCTSVGNYNTHINVFSADRKSFQGYIVDVDNYPYMFIHGKHSVGEYSWTLSGANYILPITPVSASNYDTPYLKINFVNGIKKFIKPKTLPHAGAGVGYFQYLKIDPV